ncbi:MAG: CoB--CoM heterodisulfide reductase iron-sulfur subunit B family protein [Thermoplasmata archaeon]|nr:MAG: CoB--CoM heterodisulfide reductase iron-sulfur subunit B family protein [Thermoplasmata archaeon]
MPSRAHNYEVSARLVAKNFGIEFLDIAEFGCCGLPLKSGHYETYLTIAAYNLAVAQDHGLPLVVFCNGCFGSLTEANKHLTENEKDRMRINELLKSTEKTFTQGVEIMHFSSVLYEHVGIDRIKDSIVNRFEGVKIAPHYGCHYLRPGEGSGKIDDPMKPTSLDCLIEATGATSISYEDMLQCCASPILGSSEKNAMRIGKLKLDHVKRAGADAMVIHCPLCSIMYDQYQPTMEQEFGVEYKIPVLYYAQLLGLALGFSPKELGMKKNKVKADELYEKMGITV